MMRNLVLVATVAATLTGMAVDGHAEVMKRGYIVVPPPPADATPATVSHVIFLDRCTGGCTITPGNDGTQNQSGIIGGQSRNLSAYSGSEAAVATDRVVRQADLRARSTSRSRTSVRLGAYHHAIVAGTASRAASRTVCSASRRSRCGNYIPNSMSFSFANEEPTNIADICWTVSQETAHSWGLDHKFDNRDPMTYLGTGPAQKAFQNQAGSCGEYSARACSCAYPGTGTGGMNSYALIAATFGSGTPDTTPPTVSITAPANNGSVMPGFQITANAMDDVGISKVEFKVDNAVVGTATSAPFKATAPSNLAQGAHHVEVTAYDLSNNTAMAAIDVSFGESCTTSGCSDPNQVCDNGVCVAGPGQQGGLGSPCTDNAGCASGQCGDDGAGNKYCVSPCDPAADACPSGFGCLATGGGGGVCWPGADNGGGGGGCNTGGDSGIILAGLGFAAMLITRRRRR